MEAGHDALWGDDPIAALFDDVMDADTLAPSALIDNAVAVGHAHMRQLNAAPREPLATAPAAPAAATAAANDRVAALLAAHSHDQIRMALFARRTLRLAEGQYASLTQLLSTPHFEGQRVRLQGPDGRPLGHGQLGRAAVVCACADCGGTRSFGLGEFVAHCGVASSSSADTLVVLEAHGRSLHDLHGLVNSPLLMAAVDAGRVDPHDDACTGCGEGGDLLCCDGCTCAYHLTCVGLETVPEGEWRCSLCVNGPAVPVKAQARPQAPGAAPAALTAATAAATHGGNGVKRPADMPADVGGDVKRPKKGTPAAPGVQPGRLQPAPVAAQLGNGQPAVGNATHSNEQAAAATRPAVEPASVQQVAVAPAAASAPSAKDQQPAPAEPPRTGAQPSLVPVEATEHPVAPPPAAAEADEPPSKPTPASAAVATPAQPPLEQPAAQEQKQAEEGPTATVTPPCTQRDLFMAVRAKLHQAALPAVLMEGFLRHYARLPPPQRRSAWAQLDACSAHFQVQAVVAEALHG